MSTASLVMTTYDLRDTTLHVHTRDPAGLPAEDIIRAAVDSKVREQQMNVGSIKSSRITSTVGDAHFFIANLYFQSTEDLYITMLPKEITQTSERT
jgi:hypothetical protein